MGYLFPCGMDEEGDLEVDEVNETVCEIQLSIETRYCLVSAHREGHFQCHFQSLISNF